MATSFTRRILAGVPAAQVDRANNAIQAVGFGRPFRTPIIRLSDVNDASATVRWYILCWALTPGQRNGLENVLDAAGVTGYVIDDFPMIDPSNAAARLNTFLTNRNLSMLTKIGQTLVKPAQV